MEEEKKETRSELWDEYFKKTVNDLIYFESCLEYINASDRGADNDTLMALYKKLNRKDVVWSNINIRINNLWSRRERTKIRLARAEDRSFDEINQIVMEAEEKEWWVTHAIIVFVVFILYFIFYRLTEQQCPNSLPL